MATPTYAELDTDDRPTRPCVGCGKSDKAPRDAVALPDGNTAYYHMDCHVLIAGCEVCKKVLADAGGEGPKGKKNEALLEHILSSSAEIFTTDNAADDGVVLLDGGR